MRIIAHMVVKDEMDRHLERCLASLQNFVDLIHILDDGSTDGTFEYLKDLQVSDERFLVRQRPDYVSSFAQSETIFREWAWQWMGVVTSVEAGDWVLAIDADELLEARIPVTLMAKPAFLEWRDRLIMAPYGCYELAIPEIWEENDGQFLRRVDGSWGAIRGRRLVRYVPEIQGFSSPNDRKPKPSDSVPHGYGAPRLMEDFELLHLGYLRPEDRQVKYDRYSGDGRHTSSHVRSILSRPRLETWM